MAALPPELLAKAIALAIVGEATPSPASLELVRRHVAAQAPDGLVRLRDPWAPVVTEAIASLSEDSEAWDVVANQVAAFKGRHLNRHQETRLREILDRIPPEVRRAHPRLLQAEGEAHAELGRFEEARACFSQALSLARTPEERRGLKVYQFWAAQYGGDPAAVKALATELDTEVAALVPALRARYLLWKALMHWEESALPEVEAACREVLEVVAAGDRTVLYHHARALSLLTSLAIRHARFAEAQAFSKRLLALCQEHRLERLHLKTVADRLLLMVSNDSEQISLSLLTDLPNDAFRAPPPAFFNSYLSCFAWRASKFGAHRLALALFHLVQDHAFATAHPMGDAVRNGRINLIHANGRLGEFERARAYLDELGADPAGRRHLEVARFVWAQALILGGHLDEAEQVLRQRVADPGRGALRAALFQAWIRHMRGDPKAVDDVREVLAAPGGSAFWDHEAELMQQMGLRPRVFRYHVKVFGGPAFGEADGTLARWPRKKALSLLSLLVLRPEGLPTDELVGLLYPGVDPDDAAAALHRLAYDLRQALNGVGAPELLESVRGFYRFKWEAVAFCDWHDFDALYRKAQSLEADGLTESAAILYRMALAIADKPLFEGLAEAAFEEPRRVHQARLSHAAAFSKQHTPYLEP
ncbi:Tetratricopeptide repeat protein [compost metagenome]